MSLYTTLYFVSFFYFFYLENIFSFPILTCIDEINHPYVDSVSGTALIVGESRPIALSLGRGFNIMTVKLKTGTIVLPCTIAHICFSLYEDLNGPFCKAVNLNT